MTSPIVWHVNTVPLLVRSCRYPVCRFLLIETLITAAARTDSYLHSSGSCHLFVGIVHFAPQGSIFFLQGIQLFPEHRQILIGADIQAPCGSNFRS